MYKHRWFVVLPFVCKVFQSHVRLIQMLYSDLFRIETEAAWVWQDAIPSYDYLITFFATFVPSAAIVVFTNTPFAGR